MVQSNTRLERPMRWMASVLQRSGDSIVLGGGVIGLALIIAVILIGLHERQTSFRSMSPPEQSAEGASYR